MPARRDRRIGRQDGAIDELAQRFGQRFAVQRCGHEIDLGITAGIAGVQQLAGGTEAERLAHRAKTLETREGNG